jgi:RNA polymerase sigma-70 factor (family 1)
LSTIADIQAGDPFVFEQVYEEYYLKLYHFVLGKTRSEWLAEEVTQTTFVKLWENRQRLNPEISLSLQVFRIARTTMIDYIRKQNHLSFAITQLKNKSEENENQLNNEIDYNETSRKLASALTQLPEMRRKVFELSRLEGMSYKDIAVQLSISVKTVEKHISKALQQLRPLLYGLMLIGWILRNFIKNR